jgi:type IV pilus assembly protein PilC
MAKLIDFGYSARNDAGKVVTGRLTSESQATVLTSLKNRGLTPIKIFQVSANSGMATEMRLPRMPRRVTSKDLAVTTKQLATMVAAGLPLAKAMAILVNQTENKTLARALAEVRLDVQSGVPLSASLGRRPQIFPVLMTSLVGAGETGGFIDDALDSVAVFFKSDAKLKSSIKSAMTYPIAVLVIALLGVIAMMIFVVPIFDNMFKNLGGALPWPTQILVNLSPIMTWASPFIVIGGLLFAYWWRKNKDAVWLRRVVDPVKLRIPVFGSLFKKIAVARFARNFASMIRAGVPILQALGVVGKTSGNYVVEQAILRVQESVRLGTTVSQPLSSERVFPNMVSEMISVGEDSGSLEAMLTQVADFYDSEIEATTLQLTALIEPMMIAFIGAIIGSMIITLYLPLFTIFNVIR